MSSSVLLGVLMHKLRDQTLEDVKHGQSEEHDSATEFDEQNNLLKSPSIPDLASLLSMEEENSDASRVVRPFCFSVVDEDEKIDWEHSSEEELEVINKSKCSGSSVHPEKRKWSQVNRASTSTGAGADSSGSSDDEVRELTRCSSSVSLPIEFCTSPPTDAHRPDRSQSPPAKLFHFAATLDVNPKKQQLRHRHNHVDTPTPTRPYLDFEKMQQLRTRAVSAWRPSRQVSLIC